MNEFERQHLSTIHAFLTTELDRLAKLIDKIQADAKETKINLAQETRLNFDTLADNVDTFANIESGNRQIDTLNSKIDDARTQQKRATLLLPQPYFARIDLDFGDAESEPFYIGKVSYTNSDHENLIYDWRAPVADVYYSGQLGATSYQANGRKIAVKLTLRRQFQIQNGKLLNVFDTTTAISDPVLLEILAAPHHGSLQDITTTIQAEQNAVIRDVSSDILLVDGVAGSGKTSVLLQRIAYLNYYYRDKWRTEDLLLLTPSSLFAEYIQDVLPTLGEQNPSAMTFNAYLLQLGHHLKLPLVNADLDRHHDLGTIEHKLNQVAPTALVKLIPGLAQTDSEDILIKRLQLLWRRMAATDQLPKDLSTWVAWSDIFTCLGIDTPTTLQTLYLIIRVSQYHQDSIRALFVDEAQDYTEDQMLLLLNIFKTSQLTLVGDHNQTLTESGFDQQKLLQYLQQGRNTNSVQMLTSYRSTGNITRFFGKFNEMQAGSFIKPVQAAGEKPVIIDEISKNDLVELIRVQRRETIGTFAVITGDEDSAKQLSDLLKPTLEVAVVSDHHHLSESDVPIFPLKIAKGLEFDRVLVVGFVDAYFSNSEFANQRKYVAASRATKRLTIINQVGD
ncbi:HelD family protein [Lapidilactobacillus bayanensis]|uniref:HelD family protein n=1 Tax=Lapidilactobacillus bayanensis TaxID=2485998 RepID=UPI000F7A08FE|nr:AAA family ATPase [Lapidilactobacillus bayanensis]